MLNSILRNIVLIRSDQVLNVIDHISYIIYHTKFLALLYSYYPYVNCIIISSVQNKYFVVISESIDLK